MNGLHGYRRISWLLLAACVLAAIWIYPQLPPRIATHWNMDGVINGYHSRPIAVLIPLVVMLSLIAIGAVAPRFSTRAMPSESFQRCWGMIMLATQAMVMAIGLAIWMHGAGYAVPVPKVGALGVGVVLVVAGNYLGKLPRNAWVGIRTPWTLANDQVWERTHRVGGPLLLLAGLSCIVLAGAGAPLRVLTVPPLAAAVWACIYSGWVYRKVTRA